MSNIEFIATYVFNNPGARYSEIMRALHQWRKDDGWSGDRSWGNRYLNRYRSKYQSDYNDVYWRLLDNSNPRGGYVLTSRGMGYVRPEVSAFVDGKRKNREKFPG